MPDLAFYHPQIVHFVLALLGAGVLLRWVALTGKWPWTSPAAAALLLAGTVAAVAAAKSGTDAHGPVERIPGARAAVMEHEEWGERTRNVFLVVAVLEVLGLAFATRPWRRWLYVGSAIVGLGGAFALYEAGEHGGELVYTYAGGVGTRSGDSTDVARLYLAGLYQQAQLDRRQGKAAEAGELFAQLARQYPDNVDVQLLAVESLITDKKDGKARRSPPSAGWRCPPTTSAWRYDVIFSPRTPGCRPGSPTRRGRFSSGSRVSSRTIPESAIGCRNCPPSNPGLSPGVR